jgi:hypothetical protein
MNNCFTAVSHWFAVNGLAMNPNKSEAVVVGTDAQQRAEGAVNTVQVGTDSIKVSGCVRSLGITVDSTLSYNTHANEICKAVHYHTRALRHIRKSISNDDAKLIAASMVSVRLDYFNSILYKTSQSNLAKLQRLQNSSARVVAVTRKRNHITPILADLHWLPVVARIEYKVAPLTFETLAYKQPSYLHELLRIHLPTRSLKSTKQINRFQVNSVRTSFGSRAFCHATPQIWNCLPVELSNNLSSVIYTIDLSTASTHRSAPAIRHFLMFDLWRVTSSEAN